MTGPRSSRSLGGEFAARVGHALRCLRETQLEAGRHVRELAELRDRLPDGEARALVAQLTERMVDLAGATGRGLDGVDFDELRALADQLGGRR